MPILSLSFDDDSEEPLFVFSGEDLLMAHIDEVDLDWEEVAELVTDSYRRIAPKKLAARVKGKRSVCPRF